MKEVNRYTSNEFHDWQRDRLPGSVVIQDIDAWALVSSDPTSHEPSAIIELKRSSLEPSRWMPFPEDRRNYASLLRLAERAGLPLYVVYFRMGEAITDDSLFHIFHLTQAAPEYRGRRRVTTAKDFAERFPRLFDVVDMTS